VTCLYEKKKSTGNIRTNSQDQERRGEEEEQGRQADRFAERAEAIWKRGQVVSGAP
jgi:hypothetical protein